MTQSTTAPGVRGMIVRLTALAEREDRGALAALRRGLGKEPGTTPEMYPNVEWAFESQAPDEAYIVASLFGLHPNHARNEGRARGFGANLRAIRQNDAGDEDDGVARRFTALLDCQSEALPTHLRHLVTLLRSRKPDSPIDFVQLYWDLRDWDDPDRHVQKRWAAGFWGYRSGEPGTPAAIGGDATTVDENDDDEQ